MRKLEVEDVTVEWFETTAGAARQRGTAYAHQAADRAAVGVRAHAAASRSPRRNTGTGTAYLT